MQLSRVAAVEIEALVIGAVRKRLDREATRRTASRVMGKANRLTDKSLIVDQCPAARCKPGQLAVR